MKAADSSPEFEWEVHLLQHEFTDLLKAGEKAQEDAVRATASMTAYLSSKLELAMKAEELERKFSGPRAKKLAEGVLMVILGSLQSTNPARRATVAPVSQIEAP